MMCAYVVWVYTVSCVQDTEALVSGPVWMALTQEVLRVVGELIDATTTIIVTEP